ncbi:hypothetical protein NKR23_g9113 [Pleurostoma richardsiae]|uniref:Uncharacterized protein n=1 Tax=Pleurostoma richardsiae TaxID=41990 RepID=A0AA38R7K9_9PEZI|nr:hypothetical protein NKR23_g9113 [Pleurostoma richardsiae]
MRVLAVRELVSIETREAERSPRDLAESLGSESSASKGAKGELRLAWLWAEGWREQLRKSGDVVEKCRWEWRWEDMIRKPNSVPVIVARVPGVSALKGKEKWPRSSGARKSVHWA